jgi:exodeoxyribonuclease VII small subunit
MAKEKLSFEQALEKLEEIVGAIESGQTGLEESIAKYAQGIELIKYCRGVLDSAEKKIQLLTNKQGDTLAPAGELEEPDEE